MTATEVVIPAAEDRKARPDPAQDRGMLRVGVFLRSFPVLSETFILRQLTGLLDRGHDVDVYAELRPADSRVHADVGRYGLDSRARYVDMPPASGYWEMPVRPLSGSTWLPDANGPIRNIRRAAAAVPTLGRCLTRAPRQTVKVLDRREYGYRAESLSGLYRLGALLRRPADYDVLHAHYGPIGDNFRFARELFDVPLVVSFHGYDVDSWPRAEGAGVYDRLFAAADVITANSEYAARMLERMGCPSEKLRLLTYSVDLGTFHARARTRTPGEPLEILTVARLVEKKGLADSLRAVAALRRRGRPIRYDIIGAGPLEDSLRGLVRELGLQDVVRLHGPRDSAYVADAMRRAHAFVLASVTAGNGDSEGTPVSILEAQASGLPVVSTRHAGIPEIVEHDVSGFLVDEHDVGGLTDRLDELFADPDRCERMGRAGRERIASRHDPRALLDELLDVYGEASDRFRSDRGSGGN